MNGNILCETDVELSAGEFVVLVNKYDDYPILEDKWVVRGIKENE